MRICHKMDEKGGMDFFSRDLDCSKLKFQFMAAISMTCMVHNCKIDTVTRISCYNCDKLLKD